MFNVENLEKMVTEGYIHKIPHENGLYHLLNYTPLAAFKKVWNFETLNSRGTVIDNEYNIISKPMEKFFNDFEVTEGLIPYHLPFDAFTKLDGSCIIVRRLGDELLVNTRGSFKSPQSQMAHLLLKEKYNINDFDPNYTYIFEYIGLENRIVVLYKESDVVLLTMYDMRTLEEVEYDQFPKHFNIVKRYDGLDIETMKSLDIPNEEGFVVRFSNGFRMKLKMKTYMSLHGIVTGLSSRKVWELMKDGKSLEEIASALPDEFYEFATKTKTQLQDKFDAIESKVQIAQMGLAFAGLTERKDKALWIQANAKDVAPYMYAWLDGKDFTAGIWKSIYPPYISPFEERAKLTGEN